MKSVLLNILRHRSLRLGIATLTGALQLGAQAKDAVSSEYKVDRTAIEEGPFLPDRFVEVMGSRIHYTIAGEGEPVLFIHGNPTSSYLWRNVTPLLHDGWQTIAIDLIGMGYSDKPEIAYHYADHLAYLSGLIEALDLDNIILVGHDWGAALAWDYARLNPQKIKALAFMEGVLPPIFPQPSYEAMGAEMGGLFRAMQTPGEGENMILKNHLFIEGILPQMINRPLGSKAHDAYRMPFHNPDTRAPLLAWPREVPIADTPIETTEVMRAIDHYMSRTEIPVLLLYAEPGVLIPPALVPHYEEKIRNLETAYVGQGLHFIQEDQPIAIGRALHDWARRLKN